MRKQWMFLAAGLLILNSTIVHADQATIPPSGPVVPAAGSTECCCEANRYWPKGMSWILQEGYPAMKCKGHGLGKWLGYRSSRGACGCDCTPCCSPPLYLYFLRPCASTCNHGCADGCSNGAPSLPAIAR